MDARTYSARRRALRADLADGAILIAGNDQASRNYVDSTYPYRQDSHFLYFAGISQPNMAILIEPDGREVLYGPAEDPDDVVWHGPHPSLGDYAASAGFDESAENSRLAGRIAELQAAGEPILYLPPYRAERSFKIAELLRKEPRDVAAGASIDLMRAVAALRAVKDQGEIDEIESALAVTAEMYRAAMTETAAGKTEAEIAAILQSPAIARDREQSFSPIVSVRGEILHNECYVNTLADGDLLVIDSGAESPRGYASDITRTFPVSGRFTTQQREVYEVVLQAQTNAIDAAAPGVKNRDLHLIAARTIAEGLKEIGLMKGDSDAAVEAGAHAMFFPHGLGHMLGLDAHDMEDLGDIVGYPEGEPRSSQFGLAYLRLARELEPGWVFTVEPGIYFVPALIDRWRDGDLHREFIDYDRVEAYRSFGGVRIEDDILVTSDGCRVLGPGIPKTVGEVEAAMAV
jgi:Xaa-Pro aminopeptidase